MRYFLGVARTENIHAASLELHVSPGSLSKAITRLEEELAVKLFSREGRNIRLTEHGKLLQKRVSEIIQLEESTRLEVSGVKGTIKVLLAGPEILLGEWGVPIAQKIRGLYPLSQFEFQSSDDQSALEKVSRGEAHIALVTSDASPGGELTFKTVGESKFKVYLGKAHPLHKQVKNLKPIGVKQLLQYSFVSPSHPLLGRVGPKQSLDGWRDDQFPRKIDFTTSSLKILEEIVVSGKAVAYLPEYFAEKLELEEVKVLDCPYFCTQKIKLVARKPKESAWLNQIF